MLVKALLLLVKVEKAAQGVVMAPTLMVVTEEALDRDQVMVIIQVVEVEEVPVMKNPAAKVAMVPTLAEVLHQVDLVASVVPQAVVMVVMVPERQEMMDHQEMNQVVEVVDLLLVKLAEILEVQVLQDKYS
jgi:hypothetical protein